MHVAQQWMNACVLVHSVRTMTQARACQMPATDGFCWFPNSGSNQEDLPLSPCPVTQEKDAVFDWLVGDDALDAPKWEADNEPAAAKESVASVFNDCGLLPDWLGDLGGLSDEDFDFTDPQDSEFAQEREGDKPSPVEAAKESLPSPRTSFETTSPPAIERKDSADLLFLEHLDVEASAAAHLAPAPLKEEPGGETVGVLGKRKFEEEEEELSAESFNRKVEEEYGLKMAVNANALERLQAFMRLLREAETDRVVAVHKSPEARGNCVLGFCKVEVRDVAGFNARVRGMIEADGNGVWKKVNGKGGAALKHPTTPLYEVLRKIGVRPEGARIPGGKRGEEDRFWRSAWGFERARLQLAALARMHKGHELGRVSSAARKSKPKHALPSV